MCHLFALSLSPPHAPPLARARLDSTDVTGRRQVCNRYGDQMMMMTVMMVGSLP